MHEKINLQKGLMICGIPLCLFGLLTLLTKSSYVSISNALSLGITLDLLLVIPLLYWLTIRKTKIPKTTIVPIVIIGLIIGSYILPVERQVYLNLFKTWVLPFIELSVLTLLIVKLRRVNKEYKSLKQLTPDFFTALKSACSEIFPKKVATPFATEVGIFYYAFIHWKKRELKSYEYSYHKETGTIPLLIVLLFIIGIETVVVHILLSKWSATATWVLTILSVYTLVQFLGIIKSIPKRPIAIANGKLYLKYGIAKETTIDFKDIESVELSFKDVQLNTETKKLALLGGLESHNVIIHLKKENTIFGLYGIKSRYKTILLNVDDKTKFVKHLESGIANPELTEIKEIPTSATTRNVSKLSDRQKSFRATCWILGVSFLFGFPALSTFDSKQQVGLGISMLLFALLPAFISIVINKQEGGAFKDLLFVRPKVKEAIIAFIVPFIYFGIAIGIQYLCGIRTRPDWNKYGSIETFWQVIIFGYPMMFFLLLGEEIAWRGYLQEKLINSFGALKGLFLLGLIWGIWHIPLSIQGYNLPEYPILETCITTPLMCITLSLLIGYIGWNSKSIFIGLLLHVSNNHFGGNFLQITETSNEFMHAMSFFIVYVPMLIILSILIRKRENALRIDIK